MIFWAVFVEQYVALQKWTNKRYLEQFVFMFVFLFLKLMLVFWYHVINLEFEFSWMIGLKFW